MVILPIIFCLTGSSCTITSNQLIATAVGHHLGKWSCARVPIAKDNGSTQTVLMRRICLRNGTVRNAKSKSRKLETPTQEVSL